MSTYTAQEQAMKDAAEAAISEARTINRLLDDNEKADPSPNWPLCFVSVINWTGSRESHAQNLASQPQEVNHGQDK